MSIKLVSIIMPSFNSEATINEAVNSVLKQDYAYWELIIIDDCSTDRTKQIIEMYGDDRIQLISNQANKGSAYSRNIGLEASKGELVCFLDSDDYWAPNKLSKQVSVLENFKKPSLVVTSYVKVTSDGGPIKTIMVPHKINYHTLLKTNAIPCLTTMIRADIAMNYRFKNVGHEDYLYWLNLLKDGCDVITINEPLAFYRTGRLSLSSNKFKSAGFQWNIYRNELDFGIVKSLYYFMFYMFHGVKKELC
jgi:teichuronic acid biosynthesis glycosyltransferase TuaG